VPSKDTPAAQQKGDGTASLGHEVPLSIDTSVAHVARVYDYWLGGKDNFAADRVAGEQAIRAYPDIVYSVRANRAFLARTVRYLAKDAGIRQFLDIGTGIPTANNTHEVAQSAAPGCSVVYEKEAESPAALWGGIGAQGLSGSPADRRKGQE
jgi:S-adenosyl methyltransferase